MNASPTIKAILCSKYGPPEVLQIAEVPKPLPKENEILVKVHATSVTVADVRIRAFRVPLSFWLPARLVLGIRKPKNPILGVELAGEIEAIGEAVTKFKPGEQVVASTLKRMGAYAEYTCLPADGEIAIKPATVSYEEAAVTPIGARTALHYLKKIKVQAGQKILIYGASGSVGTYAVQIAKYFGAIVTGVCSSSNFSLVKSLGADHVIDYTASDFKQQLGTYDVFFDAVDKCSFAVANAHLTSAGTYVNVTMPFKTLAMLWTSVTSKKQILTGENPPKSTTELELLMELLANGDLKAVIDRRYPLSQIVEAHRYVDLGHKKGNVVVEFL